MLDMYVSWCKGLPYDKEALALLKENDLGIELTDIDEQARLIKRAGLKYSCHNPARDYKATLSDPQFLRVIEDPMLLYTMENCSTDVVGFHIRCVRKDMLENSRKTFLNTILFNLDVVAQLSKKRILFESPIFDMGLNDQERKLVNSFTEPQFMKDILDNSKSGYLFDISHNYVSAYNKKLYGLYKHTIDDYFDEIIEATKGKVYQIHLNAPTKKVTGYGDDHHPFAYDDEVNKHLFKLTKEILRNNPVRVFTLEINSGLKPYEHAQLMVRQAKYVRINLRI